MKTLVGIKHVPDTETKVKISAEGNSLDPAAVNKWVISPYDEQALEQALQFREAHGGEVVLACAGPAEAQSTVRQGLAMGADRAVLVEDPRFDYADGLVRARALAAVAAEVEPDLILVGKYGVGTDEGLTGPMLAELLGWPHASGVSKLELSGDGGFGVERAVEGAVEVQEGRLPAVVSCDKSLNEPRYPSLKGIMQAKKKPIERKTVADLGLDPAALDQDKKLIWESLELPPARATGRLIDGSPEEAARELVKLLHEEAKVI
jgi:electron transfer flavoprotein beta subunit